MAKKTKEKQINTNTSKKQALESALAQIKKSHGDGAIMKLNDEAVAQDLKVIPTGSIMLDLGLGVGGIPRGRIVEIYGPESSGKTTLSMSILAEAQKQGEEVAFIDAEHAFDPVYAEAIGLDTEKMFVSQPDNGEQALEITETLVRSAAISCIVIDSVAALTPRAEIEGDMGDSHMGLQARLMSQALRKLTPIANRTNTTIIFINQIREKIGVMFGNPETTTGGRALKFYSSIRMEIRRIQTITDKGESVGNRTKVKIVKNKVAPPFKTVEFDIEFGKGISKVGSLLDAALESGIVEASGAWIKYEGNNIAQGRENAKNYLLENLDIYDEIETKVYGMLKKNSKSAIEKDKDKDTGSDTQKAVDELINEIDN